jgi:hypothetical protein
VGRSGESDSPALGGHTPPYAKQYFNLFTIIHPPIHPPFTLIRITRTFLYILVRLVFNLYFTFSFVYCALRYWIRYGLTVSEIPSTRTDHGAPRYSTVCGLYERVWVYAIVYLLPQFLFCLGKAVRRTLSRFGQQQLR